MKSNGISIITNSPVVEIRKGEVVTVDKIGRRRSISADSIVIAVGRKPVIPEELISEAKKIGKEVYVIGDAKTPRKVIDAIREASQWQLTFKIPHLFSLSL